MGKQFLDLTGQQRGLWTVLHRVLPDHISPNGRVNTRWLCRCQCGTERILTRNTLQNGNEFMSCGCNRSKRARALYSKPSKYDLSGDYGIGWTCNTNKEFYFDLEDYDKIKDYSWQEVPGGYVATSTLQRVYRKNIRMHRLLLGVHENSTPIIDHINGNRMDNRKANLRIATYSQNCINRRKGIDNTSGHTGVDQVKQTGHYRARINQDHKEYSLGTFETFEEAVVAREQAEKNMYGEFAPVRL